MNQNTVLSGIYRSFFKMDELSEGGSNAISESNYNRKQRKMSNDSSPTA